MDSPNENDKINEDHELQMSKHDLLLAKAEFENFLVNMKAFQDCLEEVMPKTGTVSPMETFARCISNFTINKDPQKPMIRTFLDFKECLEDISYSQQALYRRLCSQISPQIKQVTVDSAAIYRKILCQINSAKTENEDTLVNAADVPAVWWSRLGLQQTLWRGTASSGQGVPPVSGAFAPGDAPGTFLAPLPPLSGRSASHLHGSRTGTSVDAAVFLGGPARARAHGRCALKLPGCIPEVLGFLAPAGSPSARTMAAQLSAKHGDRRRHPRALVNAAVVRQHDKRQHVVPLVRVPSDHEGQHIEERLVEPLRLSIPLWVVIRSAKVHDVLLDQHLGHGTGFPVGERECDRTLGEVIRQDQDVLIPRWGPFQRS
ncbi:hypothetical protein T07_1858 [Trichinella nelsoni]|uniref:Uncharacterized protein n=1 Tax=Trichinella nelsoni TaxID=6336 RepID=A0A0V0RZW5_9BILA|nr:hypothetical protein T07_1858 [Trichinella nelsoni]